VGPPAYPCGAVVHVPSADAPSACAQTSHDPEQDESQHTPSTQLPLAHSRHCPWRQSTPGLGLQVPPCAFSATHVPFVPQKYPLAQSVSALQEVGQVSADPLHM
jgi:hypothetical protein